MEQVLCGDCLDILPSIPSQSVDLIITSPPYAESRKDSYGGISAKKYVEWFLPIANELKRVLHPKGSFFLNIKPHTERGERSMYVMDLILALKRTTGFRFIDEYCWTKNPFPNGAHGRFKNGFEPVYHFTVSHLSKINFNPLACGTPVKTSSAQRVTRKQGGSPVNGSKLSAIRHSNMKKISVARPSNVIHANNVSNQFTDTKDHPAPFPEKLVEFFVRSFSNAGMTVLDPFAGSGTVGAVCQRYNRQFILIEKKQAYLDIIHQRLETSDQMLLEI